MIKLKKKIIKKINFKKILKKSFKANHFKTYHLQILKSNNRTYLYSFHFIISKLPEFSLSVDNVLKVLNFQN
jgi:hypothetical protein